MIETLLGGLLGGAFRLAPEILCVFQPIVDGISG